ncbi:MAG: hypothetical protein KZQ79_01080, partial [Candidatus Thiodiazotropha sp. (ex Lucinoma borealis)]|nr:hypothetical protein [Candidatus Thiodiazotropha sp. (ex Lucinoma borealis)]
MKGLGPARGNTLFNNAIELPTHLFPEQAEGTAEMLSRVHDQVGIAPFGTFCRIAALDIHGCPIFV